jgi:hypothetical protein
MNATIIENIDAEIARLQQAKAILTDVETKKAPGRPKLVSLESAPKLIRRKMTAAGKARIAAAQKLRWAKLKTQSKPTAAKKVLPAPKQLAVKA